MSNHELYFCASHTHRSSLLKISLLLLHPRPSLFRRRREDDEHQHQRPQPHLSKQIAITHSCIDGTLIFLSLFPLQAFRVTTISAYITVDVGCTSFDISIANMYFYYTCTNRERTLHFRRHFRLNKLVSKIVKRGW